MFVRQVRVVVVLLQPLQEVALLSHGRLRGEHTEKRQQLTARLMLCVITVVSVLIHLLSCIAALHRSWPNSGRPLCPGSPPRLCQQQSLLRRLKRGQHTPPSAPSVLTNPPTEEEYLLSSCKFKVFQIILTVTGRKLP